VHCAESTHVGSSVREPGLYYRNNVVNSLSLLASMSACAVSRIVFSSTCTLYGEPDEFPLREAAPVQPSNPHPFTKHAVEQAIRDHSVAHGLRYVFLRYFNAAGADPGGNHGEDQDPETHPTPCCRAAR
jgi:UDP-glucose 4-epimerase